MSFMINIDDTKDTGLAMEAGNHDFEVEKVDIKTNRSHMSNITIPDHVAIMKKDDNQYLGTVGRGWEPVQPKVLYELADELITSTDGVINGAFSMYNGAVIGIRFKLAERQYIENDSMDLNFLMLTAFNGTHGIAGHATTYRAASDVQCNTSSKVYNLKHTKNVMNRLEVVKNMLRFYHNEIASFDKRMTTMVQSRMNDQAAIEWFKSLFPKPKSERAQNILTNQVSTFIDCLHNGRGSDILGVKGTCYGAFQALTEYINHYRSIRVHNDREEEEVRFQTIHFGTGNTLAQKGLNNIASSFTEFGEDEFLID
jgi:phage/plasmid-like protein (TIGR03299 family)